MQEDGVSFFSHWLEMCRYVCAVCLVPFWLMCVFIKEGNSSRKMKVPALLYTPNDALLLLPCALCDTHSMLQEK